MALKRLFFKRDTVEREREREVEAVASEPPASPQELDQAKRAALAELLQRIDGEQQRPEAASEAPAQVKLRKVEDEGAPAGVAAAGTPAVVLKAIGKPEAPPVSSAAPAAGGLERPQGDQRALYYQLMDGLYDVILILDDQGHVVDGNRRLEAVLGYTREEVWDLPIDRIIGGMTRPMFEHLKSNALEDNYILIDARCLRKDGSGFAGEVGISSLTLTRRNNLVLSIRNVERRKQAMIELKRDQAAFEVSLAPAFVCDLEGVFQVANRALLELFKIADQESLRRCNFMELVPEATRYFLRAISGEEVREELEGWRLALDPVQNGRRITAVAGSLLGYSSR